MKQFFPITSIFLQHQPNNRGEKSNKGKFCLRKYINNRVETTSSCGLEGIHGFMLRERRWVIDDLVSKAIHETLFKMKKVKKGETQHKRKRIYGKIRDSIEFCRLTSNESLDENLQSTMREKIDFSCNKEILWVGILEFNVMWWGLSIGIKLNSIIRFQVK